MDRFGPFDDQTGSPTFGKEPAARLRNGNPVTGEQGSILSVEMIRHVAEELVHLIEHSLGENAPNHEDLTQVRKAIEKIAASTNFGTLAQLRNGGGAGDLVARLNDIRTFVLEQADANTQRPFVDLATLRSGGRHNFVAHSDDIYRLIGDLIEAIEFPDAPSVFVPSEATLTETRNNAALAKYVPPDVAGILLDEKFDKAGGSISGLTIIRDLLRIERAHTDEQLRLGQGRVGVPNVSFYNNQTIAGYIQALPTALRLRNAGDTSFIQLDNDRSAEIRAEILRVVVATLELTGFFDFKNPNSEIQGRFGFGVERNNFIEFYRGNSRKGYIQALPDRFRLGHDSPGSGLIVLDLLDDGRVYTNQSLRADGNIDAGGFVQAAGDVIAHGNASFRNGNVSSQARGGANAHFWLRASNGTSRHVSYFNFANDRHEELVYNADGSFRGSQGFDGTNGFINGQAVAYFGGPFNGNPPDDWLLPIRHPNQNVINHTRVADLFAGRGAPAPNEVGYQMKVNLHPDRNPGDLIPASQIISPPNRVLRFAFTPTGTWEVVIIERRGDGRDGAEDTALQATVRKVAN